jgi:hypothetical protein
MSHHFRCCRCRGRNVMPRHWRDYARPKRCKHCGHTTFYLDKERLARQPCRCDGAYHWPAHRRGSLMCEHNLLFEANRARRSGADDDVVDALIRKARAMSEQIGLEGVEEAPPVTAMHVAVLGMLWRPAVQIDTDHGPAIGVWIVQTPGALPVYAEHQAERAALTPIEQRLQRIGTAVLARGFGLGIAVVDGRECLRMGLCSYVDIVPSEERLAA